MGLIHDLVIAREKRGRQGGLAEYRKAVMDAERAAAVELLRSGKRTVRTTTAILKQR